MQDYLQKFSNMEQTFKRLAEINRISDMLHSDDPEMQNLGMCIVFPDRTLDFNSPSREYILSMAGMTIAIEAYQLGMEAGSVQKILNNEERTKQCRSKKTTPLFYQQQHQTGESREEADSD